MKKIMMIAISLMFTGFLFAQDKKMSELKVSELPKGISEYVSKNMPGGKITRAGKIEEKGTVTYAAVVETGGTKHSYLFDKDGKFVGKGDRSKDAQGQKGAPAAKPAAKEEAAPKK